jgi:hypothetical protein
MNPQTTPPGPLLPRAPFRQRFLRELSGLPVANPSPTEWWAIVACGSLGNLLLWGGLAAGAFDALPWSQAGPAAASSFIFLLATSFLCQRLRSPP